MSRAVGGAAVAVAGVALGVATLIWVAAEPLPAMPVAGADIPAELPAEPAGSDEAELEGGGDLPSEELAAGALAPAPAPADPAPADPAPADPAPAGPAPAGPAPANPVMAVTVLNNSRVTGLADRAAAQFRSGGWPVRATGNFRGRVPVTTVYYDPGLERSAAALADAFPGLVRVRPRFAALPARGVVVVLTRDFAAGP